MPPQPPTRPQTLQEQSPEIAFPDDLALVRGSLRGDEEALDAFVERLSCVPRYLKARNRRWGSVLRDDELCDLVQDVMTLLWRKRATYEGRGPLEGWACAASLLQFYNHVRRRRPRGTVDIDDVPPEAEPAVTPPDPVERLQMEQVLDELPEPDRGIIRAKHFESRSFTEIGQVFEMSPNTAKARYYRGLEALRRRLSRALHEGDV